jgi:hypothetical protein
MSAENLAAADEQVTQEVTTLVRRYFELLYTNDLDLFAQIFDPGAHLYGLNVATLLSGPPIITERQSPESLEGEGADQPNRLH